MEEISMYGSGEGLVWVTGRGYSTSYITLKNRQYVGIESYEADKPGLNIAMILSSGHEVI